MKIHNKIAIVLMGIACLIPQHGQAAIAYDQNVTPDVIFGSGNDNGSFTVDTNGNIEVGLRAKVRYPSPSNTFNSLGNGEYVHEIGGPANGHANWNFEWSVNTDVNSTGAAVIADYAYKLQLDIDPSTGVTFVDFPDVIIVDWADHSFGLNTTPNGGGSEAPTGDTSAYGNLTTNNNVVQQSWNYGFFDSAPFPLEGLWSSGVGGFYDIRLDVLDKNNLSTSFAHSQIRVIVTPEPSTYAMLGMGLAIVAFAHRKKKAKV